MDTKLNNFNTTDELMKQGIFETIIGIFVLVTAFAFLYYSYNASGISNASKYYLLRAEFDNIDGISTGADVKISGIKVGSIQNIQLEQDTYYAVLHLAIDNSIAIPKDTRASIVTSGLIGNRYIKLDVGIEDKMLEAGERIVYTKSAMNIESLVNKLLYSFTSKS